jgi:hypothetical protein
MIGHKRMGPKRVERPTPVILIAMFQFLKAGFLLGVAGFLWLAPNSLPNSAAFEQMLFIAAHGKNISGVLVPIFGCYLIYIGVGLIRLRPGIRKNLALSSAITICGSLWKLGLFGESHMTSQFDRQTFYILILLDFAYHPEIVRCFKVQSRPSIYQRPTSTV